MNRIKNCLIFCFVLLYTSSFGQYMINFSDVNCYNFKFQTSLTSEQCLLISNSAINCKNVIIARADIYGNVIIFSNGIIDQKELNTKLSLVTDIKHNKIAQAEAKKDLFVKTYALYTFPEKSEYNGEYFEVLQYEDKIRQESVFGLAKSIWVELYPSEYLKLIPDEIEVTSVEKAEKTAKESKVNFKSKNN